MFTTTLRVSIIGVLFVGGCGELGSMTPGKMEWVRIDSEAPRAGNVYLIRGWVGLFSGGMDRLGDEINQAGVTARVFQDSQVEELAKTIVERYRSAPNPEPICLIGHSFGSDDSIVIARELDKVGVPVDLIITMDPVDEMVVPKNVKLCYNYWMPGIFGESKFLRGIPLGQEQGGSGKVVNINLHEEGKDLKEFMTNHVNIDEGAKIHKAIVEHVLEICPARATWAAAHPPTKSGVVPVLAGSATDGGRAAGAARTAGSSIGPSQSPNAGPK